MKTKMVSIHLCESKNRELENRFERVGKRIKSLPDSNETLSDVATTPVDISAVDLVSESGQRGGSDQVEDLRTRLKSAYRAIMRRDKNGTYECYSESDQVEQDSESSLAREDKGSD